MHNKHTYFHTIHGKQHILPIANHISMRCYCLQGLSSVQMFHHFTGHSKPWLQLPGQQPQPNVLAWMKQLDALHLSVNSSTISTYKLKPPLGFFYPNK